MRVELAQAYELAGRTADAAEQYEQVLRASPELLLAANNLAMLLVGRSDRASLERAGQLVDALAGSTVPQFLDTYGWVKLRLGDAPAALASLERAASARPDDPVIRYHLAMAQIAVARGEDARRNLIAALRGTRPFPGRDEAEAELRDLDRGG